MNVMLLPLHTVVTELEMDTLAVTEGLTVIFTAALGEMQPVEVTLATLLYHVVAPGAEVKARLAPVAPGMSVNPEMAEVVLCCHWQVAPVKAVPVRVAGITPAQTVWEAVIELLMPHKYPPEQGPVLQLPVDPKTVEPPLVIMPPVVLIVPEPVIEELKKKDCPI